MHSPVKNPVRFTVATRRSEEPRHLPGVSRFVAWHCLYVASREHTGRIVLR